MKDNTLIAHMKVNGICTGGQRSNRAFLINRPVSVLLMIIYITFSSA